MAETPMQAIRAALAQRFGTAPEDSGLAEAPTALAAMAARGSVRAFRDEPVPEALLRMLAGIALAAPTKSDLQQRDILIVTDPELRRALDACCATQKWLPGAPALLVFLANHRRQRRLSTMAGHGFANDHLDALFNAAVDAAISLGAYVTAAEAAGLGCCPVSAIRNQPERVSELLALPDRVIPVAGLALGWPAREAEISLRLPLTATVHENRFDDRDEEAEIRAYDARRRVRQPYAKQRAPERFGEAPAYGWVEDKARQYAAPERAGFGAYVRAKGFSLD